MVMIEFLTYYFTPILFYLLIDGLSSSCNKKKCNHEWVSHRIIDGQKVRVCYLCGERLDEIFTFTTTENNL